MLVAKAELNYYPEHIYEEEYKEINKNNNRNKNKKTSKKKNNSKVLVKLICLFMAIILLSTSLFILFGYSKISKVRAEVTELERHKVELEKDKVNLLTDLEGVKNSLNVSEDAMYKLGMSYPKEGQVIYLSTEDPTGNTIQSAGASNKLNEFISIFSGLF